MLRTSLEHVVVGPVPYFLYAALVLWYLPEFGERVLSFLRDWRRYRSGD
jgi:hypothetical protein